MKNIVDLFDITIKKNDIRVFNKDCDNDKQNFTKTQSQLTNQIKMLDTIAKQTQLLMSNPFEK